MQDRPLFSPKTWSTLLRPPLALRWLAARTILDQKAPWVKIMLHSDGAFRPFIQDIIQMKVNILDPIQYQCVGMDVYSLKQAFGNELSFHGAIDTQYILPHGNREQIIHEVKRCISALAHGEGYILSPCHNVQSDVNPANLILIYETALNYGEYPLKDTSILPPIIT